MAKSSIIGAVALAGTLAVMACSSTSTGTGTGTGAGTKTGGKGLFGGASSGGGASGGGSGTVPTSCSAAAGDDTCTACLKQSCCNQTLGCANDSECVAVFNCAGACADQDCITNCVNAHPNAQTSLQNVINCEQRSCVAACESGGSSGSSGSSGASGCLSGTPQDPSYCPNTPGAVIVDCPNGPPSSSCTPSPSGASGIYCCTGG